MDMSRYIFLYNSLMLQIQKESLPLFMTLILLQQQRMINKLIQKLSNMDNPVRQKEEYQATSLRMHKEKRHHILVSLHYNHFLSTGNPIAILLLLVKPWLLLSRLICLDLSICAVSTVTKWQSLLMTAT